MDNLTIEEKALYDLSQCIFFDSKEGYKELTFGEALKRYADEHFTVENLQRIHKKAKQNEERR